MVADFWRRKIGEPKEQGGSTMAKETTLVLENYFVVFIEDMIASGRYSSPKRVVEAGLRLLEESESREAALTAAIQEGEDSGWVKDFDFDEFLARRHAQARKGKRKRSRKV
jgi:antitoxin ParD1/3/4